MGPIVEILKIHRWIFQVIPIKKGLKFIYFYVASINNVDIILSHGLISQHWNIYQDMYKKKFDKLFVPELYFKSKLPKWNEIIWQSMSMKQKFKC